MSGLFGLSMRSGAKYASSDSNRRFFVRPTLPAADSGYEKFLMDATIGGTTTERKHGMDGILQRADADGVATLTLNRPQARNALSIALMAALQAEFDAIAADPSVRVVVVAARGPAFCAGHDLREIRSNPGRDAYEELFSRCSDLMLAITRLPQPVIAQVHAIATAAGCQLVASCDLAIAAAGARFATPGVNIGLFCSTPMVAVSRNVPRKRMMEMLLTGETIDAETAAGLGLVNKVVEASQPRRRGSPMVQRKSRRNRRLPSRSANKRFTASSTCLWRKPIATLARRWSRTCSPATPGRALTPFCRSARPSGRASSRAIRRKGGDLAKTRSPRARALERSAPAAGLPSSAACTGDARRHSASVVSARRRAPEARTL